MRMFPAIKSSTVQHGVPFRPLCAAACKQRIEDCTLSRQRFTALGPLPRAHLGARYVITYRAADNYRWRTRTLPALRAQALRRCRAPQTRNKFLSANRGVSASCRYRDIPYQFRIAGPLPRVTRRSGGSKPSAPSIVPFSQSARVPQVNCVLRPFRPAFTL